jgi:hypothetical protein
MAATAPTIVPFRVHFDDGTKSEVDATTPQEAGKAAVADRGASESRIITKIKQVRA